MCAAPAEGAGRPACPGWPWGAGQEGGAAACVQRMELCTAALGTWLSQAPWVSAGLGRTPAPHGQPRPRWHCRVPCSSPLSGRRGSNACCVPVLLRSPPACPATLSASVTPAPGPVLPFVLVLSSWGPKPCLSLPSVAAVTALGGQHSSVCAIPAQGCSMQELNFPRPVCLRDAGSLSGGCRARGAMGGKGPPRARSRGLFPFAPRSLAGPRPRCDRPAQGPQNQHGTSTEPARLERPLGSGRAGLGRASALRSRMASVLPGQQLQGARLVQRRRWGAALPQSNQAL